MNNIFHPKAHFNNIYEITPSYLKDKGISGVLLDIDNTLVPYSVRTPDTKLTSWLNSLKENNIKTAILSNAKVERIKEFTKELNLDAVIGKAGKPLTRGFIQAEKELGIGRDRMCIIGDQFFTDILGGNINKVFSIWVTPIEEKEPAFIRTKRLLEKPIVYTYKRKFRNRGEKNVGLLGLLGYPVGHSISPQIHNTICAVTGYNFYYDKFEVKPEQLKEVFSDLKNKSFKGLNITLPHKENIMKYLDEVDGEARRIGAVNTVVFNNGKAFGYNTDINGFARSVLEMREIKGLKVLILGAGGGARGGAAACLKNGASSVDFSNRTISKARELADMFGGEVTEARGEYFSNKFKEYDLIVNATSAGMKPQEDCLPVDCGFEFREGQICFDIIYNPEKTLFLQKAEREGAKIVNGKGMLFWQAIEAFDKWAEAAGLSKLTDEQIKEVRNRLGK